MPVDEPIVAIDGVLLLHVPPPDASLNVDEVGPVPPHTVVPASSF